MLQPGSDPIRRFDPYALVLDPGTQELGRDAHVLAGHGFEVEAVSDLEAAACWLEVQGERPGVALLAADLDEKAADAIADGIAQQIPGGTAALVLVGSVAGRAEARHLADLGFLWLVRRPFTPPELHLGASAALSAGSWSDARTSPRVPVDLRVEVACPGRISTATVRDLSAGGMFLAMQNPPENGADLVIEMELGARKMLLRGSVVHSSHRAAPGSEFGVGIQFERLEDGDGRAVADYVDARLGSVRL